MQRYESNVTALNCSCSIDSKCGNQKNCFWTCIILISPASTAVEVCNTVASKFFFSYVCVYIILPDCVHIQSLELQRDTCKRSAGEHRLKWSVNWQRLQWAEYLLCNRQEQWMVSEQEIFPSSLQSLTDTEVPKAPLSSPRGATVIAGIDLEL